MATKRRSTDDWVNGGKDWERVAWPLRPAKYRGWLKHPKVLCLTL
jgi:hypothetical protein